MKTILKYAQTFLESNPTSKGGGVQIAMMVESMTFKDVVSAARNAMVEFCPHKSVCPRNCYNFDCEYIDLRLRKMSEELNHNLTNDLLTI